MAKIGLIDVDGHNFPNLPLMKLSAFHKAQGDTVESWMGLTHYDRVYVSKVFTDTPDIESVIMADEVIHGGTGYGLEAKLPDKVEQICPDYSLYPQHNEAYGFLTRGCPRDCPFCIVTEKEGAVSRHVANLDEFWRGQKIIKLLDPNILACKDREKLLKQLAESKAYVDFTQGVDIRLVKDVIQLLDSIKTKAIHFAWDNPEQDLYPQFAHYIKTAKQNKSRKPSVYVLTNFNSTHEQDLERIYRLRELGYDPYVMIFDKANAPRQTRLLQRWVNNRIIFATVQKFEDYNGSIG
jgi:hypothetical protein